MDRYAEAAAERYADAAAQTSQIETDDPEMVKVNNAALDTFARNKAKLQRRWFSLPVLDTLSLDTAVRSKLGVFCPESPTPLPTLLPTLCPSKDGTSYMYSTIGQDLLNQTGEILCQFPRRISTAPYLHFVNKALPSSFVIDIFSTSDPFLKNTLVTSDVLRWAEQNGASSLFRCSSKVLETIWPCIVKANEIVAHHSKQIFARLPDGSGVVYDGSANLSGGGSGINANNTNHELGVYSIFPYGSAVLRKWASKFDHVERDAPARAKTVRVSATNTIPIASVPEVAAAQAKLKNVKAYEVFDAACKEVLRVENQARKEQLARRCTPMLSTSLSPNKRQRRIYLPLGDNGELAVAHSPVANSRAGFVKKDVDGPRVSRKVLCGCCGIFMEVNFPQTATSVPSTDIRLLHVVYGWYQTLKKDLKLQAQLLRLLCEYQNKKRTMSLLLPLPLLKPVFSAGRDEYVVITANSINKVVDARYPIRNDNGIRTCTARRTVPA
ncbi:hypothetical protein Rhopal_007116-T1 [Rhodotorula paludigena]|uniref:PLD phosphodiesterase domain-containing protein n=1 Tax=Rhodotorula paludigena TaxID=86838 RepID=A0AAV5GV07_9BASI|nr:hypothetical protein Rhopal_007116-T1 [Rhodotorula paludigena]